MNHPFVVFPYNELRHRQNRKKNYSIIYFIIYFVLFLYLFIVFYFLVVFPLNHSIIHFFIMICGIRTNRKWNYEHVSVLPFIFVSCCKCCKLQMLQMAVLQFASVAFCNCCKLQVLQIAFVQLTHTIQFLGQRKNKVTDK